MCTIKMRYLPAKINFLRVYHNPEADVRSLFDEKHRRQVNESQERLILIVEAIIFLEKPFRGSRTNFGRKLYETQ